MKLQRSSCRVLQFFFAFFALAVCEPHAIAQTKLKTPTYIDCQSDRIVIYPSEKSVTFEELNQPNNELEQLLNDIEAHRANQYVVVLARPGSVKIFRTVRNKIAKRQIEVVYEFVEAELKINGNGAMQALNISEETTPEPTEKPPKFEEIPFSDWPKIVAELSAKQKRIRDFRATLVEKSRYFTQQSRVFYRTDGDLMRIERAPVRPQTDADMEIYDGEHFNYVVGEKIIRFKTPQNIRRSRVFHALDALTSTNLFKFDIKVADGWVILDRTLVSPYVPDVDAMMQNPETAKKLAELETKMAKHAEEMAKLAAERGAKTKPEDWKFDLQRAKEVFQKPHPPSTSRYWINRKDGFCYVEERIDEFGDTTNRREFVDVEINVGLSPDVFRPPIEGKQLVEVSGDLATAMFEAENLVAQENFRRGFDRRRPSLPPVPMTRPAEGKRPIFLECRENQLFFIEKEKIDEQVAKILSSIPPAKHGDLEGFQQAIKQYDGGTDYYKIDARYLLVGKIALIPRAGVKGENISDLKNEFGKFQSFLSATNKAKFYLVFLTRDDSFAVYREARRMAIGAGFDTAVELLDTKEPIQFGMSNVAPAPKQ
jgi:outer membrane lipoprotein-sorting protein